MSRMRVATRLAWSFVAVFVIGLLLIAAFAYFELVIEPASRPDAHETLLQGVIEIAAEAAITVALLSLAGWWFARRALRPVELLADAADRIHEDNLTEPIAMPGGGAEYERLAQVFNAMTARLHASFQRVRQFTLYASHELKTPLAILSAEFERLVDDPARSEADRALFGSHREEIERLARLVDGLTFLTKADARLIPLQREPVSLKPLLMNAAEDTAALGAEHEIKVTLMPCDEVMLHADRHRLRQLLVILCDNAVKYNQPGGQVTMSLERTGDEVRIRIINTGPGIASDEQARVFERFYRGSSTQADGIEGMGLGLSIAQWIVTEHGGTLSFTSEPESTEFVVKFDSVIS